MEVRLGGKANEKIQDLYSSNNSLDIRIHYYIVYAGEKRFREDCFIRNEGLTRDP